MWLVCTLATGTTSHYRCVLKEFIIVEISLQLAYSPKSICSFAIGDNRSAYYCGTLKLKYLHTYPLFGAVGKHKMEDM